MPDITDDLAHASGFGPYDNFYLVPDFEGKITQLNPNGPDDFFVNTGSAACDISECYLFTLAPGAYLPTACGTTPGPTSLISMTPGFVIEYT